MCKKKSLYTPLLFMPCKMPSYYDLLTVKMITYINMFYIHKYVLQEKKEKKCEQQ